MTRRTVRPDRPGRPRCLRAERVEAARLTLVPLSVDHTEEMADVLADPALYTFIGGRPLTPVELYARYKRMLAGPFPHRDESWLNWVLRSRAEDRLVGTVQATVTPEAAEAGTPRCQAAVAWILGAPWQGRGYATEAARALVAWLHDRSVSVITANIHPDNTASAAVAERIGLRATDDRVDDETVWRDEYLR